jgi:hypothetical protein
VDKREDGRSGVFDFSDFFRSEEMWDGGDNELYFCLFFLCLE